MVNPSSSSPRRSLFDVFNLNNEKELQKTSPNSKKLERTPSNGDLNRKVRSATHPVMTPAKVFSERREYELNLENLLDLPEDEWVRKTEVLVGELARVKSLYDSRLVNMFLDIVLERITKAAFFKTDKGRNFLKEVKTLKDFINKIDKLSKDDRWPVLNLIGGENGLAILRRYLDPKVQKGWIEHLKILKAIEACETVVYRFPPMFDGGKISNILPTKIIDTFRSYLRTRRAFIKINGISLSPPRNEKLSELQAEKAFLAWLIEHGNKALGVEFLEEQVQPFFNNVIPLEKRNELETNFVNFFENSTVSDLDTTFSQFMVSKDFPEEFRKWAETNFKPFLEKKKLEFRGWTRGSIQPFLNDPKYTLQQYINNYIQDLNSRVAKEKVPFNGILQSLTFEVFSAHFRPYVENQYPDFFKDKPDQIKMKTFPTDTADLEIETKSDTYDATRVQHYRFYKSGKDPKDPNQNRYLGSLDIHCTVTGSVNEDIKTGAKLHLHNLRFEEGTTKEERLQIIKGLELPS